MRLSHRWILLPALLSLLVACASHPAEPIEDCRTTENTACAAPATANALVLADAFRPVDSEDGLNAALSSRQRGSVAPVPYLLLGSSPLSPAPSPEGLVLSATDGARTGIQVGSRLDGPIAPLFRLTVGLRFADDTPKDAVFEVGLSSVAGDGWAEASSSLWVKVRADGVTELWNGGAQLWTGAVRGPALQILLDLDETRAGNDRATLTINGERLVSGVSFRYPDLAHRLALVLQAPQSHDATAHVDSVELQQFRAPFPLSAKSFSADYLNIDVFKAAGLNVVGDAYALDPQAHRAAAAGLRWATTINLAQDPLTRLETVRDVLGSAWQVAIEDEAAGKDLPAVKQTIDAVRARFPGIPIAATVPSAHNPGTVLWDHACVQSPSTCEAAPAGYDYDRYLEDILATTGAETLLYDFYPFLKDGTTMSDLFANLAIIRNKGLSRHLPYGAFLQSIDVSDPTWQQRAPSESDLRVQAYAHLAAGFSSLIYWPYAFKEGNGLVDQQGNPAPLYVPAQKLNSEINCLAKALVFLTSRDVRFVPGRRLDANSRVVPNPIPAGVQAWTTPEDVGERLLSIQAGEDVQQPAPDAWLGTLEDYADPYFMLVNLSHGPGLSADASQVAFRLSFRDDVEAVLRLDPATCSVVRVPLDADHGLTVQLPGGTGALFKYDIGSFVGVEAK
ncbi:MAG: hypothetical protein AB7P03_22345 [Kofleriaceae bacterium]